MTITAKQWTETAAGATAFILGLFVSWQAEHGQGMLPGSAAVPLAGIPLGMLLSGAGILLLLWCEGRTIDRGRGRVTIWSGPLIGLRRRSYELSCFDAVRVSPCRPEARSGPAQGTGFIVTLCGSEDTVLISRHATHHEARIEAEETAPSADLDLRDSLRSTALVTRRAVESILEEREAAEREECAAAAPAIPNAAPA